MRMLRFGTTLGLLVTIAAGCSSSDDAGARGGGTTDSGGGAWRGDSGGGGDASRDAGWGGGHDGGVWGGPAADAGPSEPPPPPPDPPRPDGGVDPDAGEVDLCAHRETMDPLVLYLSSDDSNSMAAPVIARSEIEAGRIPSWRSLRTWEFLNYYNVPYPLADEDHVRVVAEARRGAGESEVVLQVGVQAPPPADNPRARVLTLVLDTSGSMGGFPIERERQVVRAIAAHLRRGDIVSAVVWNTERTVLMDGYAVTGPSDARVLDLATRLEADGGTDVNAGLRFGYDLARRHYDARRQNRVVFISDGQANAGETEVSTIADAARDGDAEAIYLVGVGVGHGYDDTIMNELTDAGRGAYVYIDSPAEADRLFSTRFDEIMEVALMDVRLQLTLPWYMAVTQFSGEEISTDPAVVREQHLAPGDAMVFHQVLEACDPTEISDDDAVIARATYVRPTGRIAASDEITTTLGALLGGPTDALTRGDAIVAYAEALAAIARGDFTSLEEAHAIVDDAIATLDAAPDATTDRDLVEIRRLLVAVRGLVR